MMHISGSTGGTQVKFDIESIRFRGESDYADVLRQLPGVDALAARISSDPARVRRALMARSLLLSEGMAPNLYRVARCLVARFGIDVLIEIYQAAGAENAAMHTVRSPVLMEVQGRMLSLLDDDTLAALLGHELGHYLAHGEDNPHRSPTLAAMAILHGSNAPEELMAAAQRLSMAQELTADRIGLIACSGVDAALRLEMVVVTGLAAETLTWDTEAYLAQSRDLMEATLAEGEIAEGSTHPEHSLRTWALWLFSETDIYRQLSGRGSGTRTLAEVDALLLRVLGHPQLEIGIPTMLEDPPVEVHECALAACVLVAAADGEFHDLEMQAIERVFAPLVPQWRDSLDPERALAEFQRLAPLITASGPRLQRSLFSVLAHVLAVDGECSSGEVEVIVAIGGALGCRKLFIELLPAVLAHFGLDVHEALARPERSIPMPPRGADVDEALTAYFQSVARRGGGQVSLRRLLRMIGAYRSSPELIERLANTAQVNGLGIDPALGDNLDAIHRLELLPGVAAPSIELPDAPVQGSGPGGERLRRALARLRDKLISGDGRSPSIRMQVCRPGRSVDLYELEGVSTGLAERTLVLLRAGKRARLFDASEIGAHEVARRQAQALVQLERERSTRFEETGADDLYLGYPFVTGLSGGYLFRAPLILHPVRIERGTRGAGTISLIVPSDTVPIANQSALRLIFHRKGYRYPDELAEKADELAAVGPEALLGELALIGLGTVGSLDRLQSFADRREELAEWRDDRLEVEECAVLGLFPQSSSDLLQDYDALLAVLDKGAPPVELFASAREVLPIDLREALSSDMAASTGVEVPPPIPVLYADPVQRGVLAAARTAPVLVVDGPPGTGKSQVIVNLVADALARGEKVAVVCEKRAALDVVAHRLDGVGLRNLLAVVHDVQEDRRALYGQVAARFENLEPRSDDASRCGLVAGEVKALMERLEQRAALTMAVPPGHQDGDADPMVLGRLHTYASGLEVDQPCQVDALAALPPCRLDPLAAQIGALFPNADLWRRGSPWRDPAGASARPSLASYDNDKARALMASLIAARDAATALEQALTEAGLPAGEPGHKLLQCAGRGLSAALDSRKWRDVEAGRDAFVALLADETTPDTVERTQSAWHALIDSRAQRQDAGRVCWFGELIAALAEQPEEANKLMELVRLWREHEAALEPFAGPVRFSIDPVFELALGEIRTRAGSLMRILSPAWWQARKTVRASLSSQWPEMAAAPMDRALLARIDGRAAAAKCWRALADAMDWLAPTQPPGSLAEVRAWLGVASALIAPARAIAGCRADMQILGVWRAAPGPGVITAWDKEAESWIDWHHRAQALRTSVAILQVEKAALQAVAAWPERWDAETVASWDRRIDCVHAATKAVTELASAAAPIRAVLSWLPQLPAAQWLGQLAEAWRRDASRLVGADHQLAAAQAMVHEAAVFPFHLADGAEFDSPEAWADGVRKTWSRAAIDAVEKHRADLSLLDQVVGTTLQADEARLAALHDEERRLAVQHILARQDDSLLLQVAPADKGARRTPEQTTREAILREAKKQRNILPLRGFVRRFWDKGLLDVLPVWLLSPETATLLFPRAPVFDLVIFDEASQCTVENGLPVLMRARRAVIAGDERQMPPSNFFKAGDDGDEESSEAGNDAREMFDAESLLVLARHRVQRMGLAWHYRCQHEELIAFSNHAIYGGELHTIPSTVSRLAPAAVHWLDVPNGRYENGANAPEAQAVIDLVERLLQRPDKPSLGIVTFNLTQRRAIFDEIDRRVGTDAEFAELWMRANAIPRIDDRPFVKNLESVQGDERDVIVFSLGHAPVERTRRDGQTEHYVPARFGPLGQRGGERRLNVAVSRAKQEIFVVASFAPHMLSVARSKHDGPRLFKGFLQFAYQLAAGQRNQAEQTLKAVGSGTGRSRRVDVGTLPASWVPLNAQVALALEKLGIKCELDVGTSGFRVPLAVVDAADSRHYRLGILFDEAIEVETVFERHLHIPNVLASRGWKLLRISSREWDTNREQVLAEIRTALGDQGGPNALDASESSRMPAEAATHPL
ncbi:AAA domain-containing protein [Denitratisoma oestradiolicum]|uniref:Uncharacterized protein n=1 Tax=Denitratisoma oestradiolicum TaxID=311182 RepID=A0A6S6XXD5_9PROT|nr:AAA domain-containing protein [Denitratisoma oestradiolicum]TWO81883.1 hypothetical protein CBW56_00030 [Denitratisoma oestradiolicum]CAB1368767.1 conserved protein of unknown function [Denitratisoma oestradiolicum]